MIKKPMRFDVESFKVRKNKILGFKRYKGMVEIKEYESPENMCSKGWTQLLSFRKQATTFYK